jgi:hypothetical protein
LLTRDEIHEISDDPFFYLSDNKGQPLHQDLLNVEFWNKGAGLGDYDEEVEDLDVYRFYSVPFTFLKNFPIERSESHEKSNANSDKTASAV